MYRQYNALQCLLFAFLIPVGVSVSACGQWTVDSGQWTPYHMPQLLTHPSAGSMVLVGTGTTASVELEPGELCCTGIVSSVSPLQTPQTHTFTLQALQM